MTPFVYIENSLKYCDNQRFLRLHKRHHNLVQTNNFIEEEFTNNELITET